MQDGLSVYSYDYLCNQRHMILKGFEMASIMDALSAEEFGEEDPLHYL